MVTSNQSISILVPSHIRTTLRNLNPVNLLVEVGQNLVQTRGVPPIAHQVGDDAKCAHQGNSSLLHATVGIGRQLDIKGPAGLGVGEDLVSLVDERESQEGGAYLVSLFFGTSSRKDGTYKLR